MEAEHVRLVQGADGKPCARCLHCGKEEPLPPMPAELGLFSQGLRAITKKHADCPPNEEAKVPT